MLPLAYGAIKKQVLFFKRGTTERRVAKAHPDAGRIMWKRVLFGDITQSFRFLINIDGWMEVKVKARGELHMFRDCELKMFSFQLFPKENHTGESKVVIKELNGPQRSLGPSEFSGQACRLLLRGAHALSHSFPSPDIFLPDARS